MNQKYNVIGMLAKPKFLNSRMDVKLGVSHVNLVFDFGSIANDLKKRLEYAKQIKDALIPPIIA